MSGSSVQHGGGAPGPPPTPVSAGGANGEFFPQRRRAVPAHPPSITTNFLRAQGSSPLSQTPISAGNATPFPYTPATPVTYNPAVLQPGSVTGMEPYNPRQWNQTRQVSGSQMVYGRSGSASTGTTEVTGMEEAMPSPPPPYSPETPGPATRVAMTSPMLEDSRFSASPHPRDNPSRHSPAVPMSPAFPPPPGPSSRHRERSASGLAGTRAFFSGLRGKQPANTESQVHQSSGAHMPQFGEARPPAARRAASTGHMQLSGHGHAATATIQHSSSERSTPDNSWQPGMPLPPPPPGPPPPGTRSQSLNRFAPASSRPRVNLASEQSFEGQRQRRAAASSSLGPVPPTPAGWTEEHDSDPSQSDQSSANNPEEGPAYQPLRIDTGAGREIPAPRRPARREPSAQGIRERRSLSRRAKEQGGTETLSPVVSDDSRPSDLILAPVDGSIRQRREQTRAISGDPQPASKGSNTREVSNGHPSTKLAEAILTPPYTPAVGREDADPRKKAALRMPSSAASDRPISHLLHTPNEDASILAPLSPSRPASAGVVAGSSKLDGFALQALERHRSFVEKEAMANSDEERLELFASFIVHESRLRRDRYTAAYNSMAGEVMDLTRNMWRPYTKESKRAITPSTSMSSFDPTVPSWASDGQRSANPFIPSSASSFGDFTPATDVASIGDDFDFEHRDAKPWADTFKPSLSPIQSVAQSNSQDEDGSRGRAPSRWWEQSSGSGSIGRPERLEKSHRETKYMGIRASELQESAEPSPAHTLRTATPSALTQSFGQGSDGYPPEKAGWADNVDFDTPMATPAHALERKASTPVADQLDVSRLVTLPPPYPRHHPAVNNSHPLLAALRNDHRKLADHSDIQNIKDGFLDPEFAARQEQQRACKERRNRLRSSIQAKISSGSISFADAAQVEADFDKEEAERGKAAARALFDMFETSVAQPLNQLLTNRIKEADVAVGQLRTELSFGVRTSDPNQAQEEGDEQPERLEKLTLLKWLFESREQLHKEMFDLHAARSEKYSEVILTPYRIQRLQNKIDEAVGFFTKDSIDRQRAYAKDAFARFEDLQQVMEKNVSRGVEDQLSAFWDIAPSLLEVISRVPIDETVSRLEIQIPAQEYEENPIYHEYPLQYLYSLLSHAGKSAYQFIESQTNLLCLLHEVRTATSKCALRLAEIERSSARPGSEAFAAAETMEARRETQRNLDQDLKEKVGQVEVQWKEALGDALQTCKERVRESLEMSGGWEDGLDE
ncbi:hypothetical protein KC315_g11181 [Hortaea werneckii]|uniref:Uncharacterized protein n=1 Tax=Hortaea werneckii TaxID=91943 RepID=A0A3M7E027_HORWE|nr:hypothetical protein KC315_g11181 [Hortaea werneckii]RMY69737.1 hypothetical protein D0863_06256 [Hortaea werneckii]